MLGLSRVAHYSGRLLHGKPTNGMGTRSDHITIVNDAALGQGLCR